MATATDSPVLSVNTTPEQAAKLLATKAITAEAFGVWMVERDKTLKAKNGFGAELTYPYEVTVRFEGKRCFLVRCVIDGMLVFPK